MFLYKSRAQHVLQWPLLSRDPREYICLLWLHICLQKNSTILLQERVLMSDDRLSISMNFMVFVHNVKKSIYRISKN